MRSRGIGRTDVGRVRDNNEDSFHVDEALGIYIVSDGMGGHSSGEIASRLAVGAALEHLRANESALAAVAVGDKPARVLISLVDEAVQAAAGAVFDAAQGEHRGMGCTLTLLLVAGDQGALGHVGDSRLYLCRSGRVNQLTTDHTVVAELVRAGRMTAAEGEGHPYANTLSRVIGSQPAVKSETLLIDLAPGDRLLLCSDGLSNYLEDPAALVALLDGDVKAAADGLIGFANEAGGQDNITAVVVQPCSDEVEDEHVDRLSTIERRYSALRGVFLFDELRLQLLTRVMSMCDIEHHPRGSIVVAQGEDLADLLVVVDGCCTLQRNGREVGKLQAGEHTGVTTLYSPRQAYAELLASESATLLRLSGRRLRQLARQRPWLGIGLLERLTRQLSRDLERSYGQRSGSGVEVAAGERL